MNEITVSDKELALRQKILEILDGLPARYKKEILRLCLDQIERAEC